MCLVLIACGVLFMLLAAIQHRKSIRRLFRSGMEAHYSLAQFAAILVSGVGIVGFWLVLVGFLAQGRPADHAARLVAYVVSG